MERPVEIKEPLEEKKWKEIEGDTSILDETLGMQQEDNRMISKVSPMDLVETDLRLREGVEYKGDKFKFDGVEIILPQLTFIQLRKAQRESYLAFDDKPLLKRFFDMLREARKLKKEDDELDLTFDEEMKLRELNDVQDLWLMHFALVESNHPKASKDFDSNRKWFERVNPSEAENFISKLKIVNVINEGDKDTPSGEEVVKSFHDDKFRVDVEKAGEIKPVSIKGLDDS